MADLADGARVQVQGSTSTYTLERKGDVRSCTCPAWRNQALPIERRTCKHLRAFIGDLEAARAGGAPAPARLSKRPAWVPEVREDREVRDRRRAELARTLEQFPVAYDKMLLAYGLRMPRHLAYAVGWWRGLTRAERDEAWAYIGTGPMGVADWLEEGGLARELQPGLDARLDARYRRDPLELVSVFGGNSDGAHWGLWYDDPSELPRTIVHNYARDSAETYADQPTLLATLRADLFDKTESLDPAFVHVGTIVDWLDDCARQELDAHHAETISPVPARAHVVGGFGPWIPGWTIPADLGEERDRYDRYRARDPIVETWIAGARAALATEPGRALAIGRELHWLDADAYRAASTELLVGAYRALGRDALADIARLHHEHRDLPSVAVYTQPPPSALRRATSERDFAAIAELARDPARAAEVGEELRTIALDIIAALLAAAGASAALVESAAIHHAEEVERWSEHPAMSAEHRAALLTLLECGVTGQALMAIHATGDAELSARALARADLTWRSERGRSVLHVACRAAWVDGVRALLERGADVHLRDADKELPWDAVRAAWMTHTAEASAMFDLVRAKGGEPAPPKPAIPAGTWTVGAKVTHAKFGAGTITAATGLGDDAKLTVEFGAAGNKVLLGRFVVRA